MNWYFKNMENLLFIVAVAFMLLMIVDLIWGKREGKWPLSVGLAPAVICLLGLITTLPVWFEAPKVFVIIISPASSSVWLGWIYAVKILLVVMLIVPLFFMGAIVFTAKAFLPHTWIF